MNKSLAIMWLFPEAKPADDFAIGQDETGQFITHWGIEAPIPTDEELETAWEAYQSHEAATAYRVKRAAEYPGIGDQLDALFKAGLMPKDMAAQIQAVKDKYPKGKV